MTIVRLLNQPASRPALGAIAPHLAIRGRSF